MYLTKKIAPKYAFKIGIVISILTCAVSGEMIGDFAPLTVGNTWVYHYNNQSYFHYFILYDSGIVTITVESLNRLRCDYMDYSGVTVEATHPDTPEHISYFDTIGAKGDSVILSRSMPGFASLPFYSVHTISEDKLSKAKMGNDLVYISSNKLPIDNSFGIVQFIQNIGLYKESGRGMYDSINVRLISFNGRPIPDFVLSANSLQRRFAAFSLSPSYKLRANAGKDNLKSFTPFFSVDGKKSAPTVVIPRGVYIEKIR